MVNDIATLCPAAATPHPAMADRVAWLREQIERGAYEIDLAALAIAMLGFGKRQIPDGGTTSKV